MRLGKTGCWPAVVCSSAHDLPIPVMQMRGWVVPAAPIALETQEMNEGVQETRRLCWQIKNSLPKVTAELKRSNVFQHFFAILLSLFLFHFPFQGGKSERRQWVMQSLLTEFKKERERRRESETINAFDAILLNNVTRRLCRVICGTIKIISSQIMNGRVLFSPREMSDGDNFITLSWICAVWPLFMTCLKFKLKCVA